MWWEQQFDNFVSVSKAWLNQRRAKNLKERIGVGWCFCLVMENISHIQKSEILFSTHNYKLSVQVLKVTCYIWKHKLTVVGQNAITLQCDLPYSMMLTVMPPPTPLCLSCLPLAHTHCSLPRPSSFCFSLWICLVDFFISHMGYKVVQKAQLAFGFFFFFFLSSIQFSQQQMTHSSGFL